jgi:hypothetical protein
VLIDLFIRQGLIAEPEAASLQASLDFYTNRRKSDEPARSLGR